MFNSIKAMAAAAAVAGLISLTGASNASAVRVGTVGTPIGSGSMAFTATGPSVRIVINGTLALNCSQSALSGTINTGSYATTFPITIGTAQLFFAGVGGSDCVGPSGFQFGFSCTNTAQYQLTGSVVGGVTPGRLNGINCQISFTALGCTATMIGSVPMSYQNPTVSTPGRFTVSTAGQSLNVTSSCPSSVMPGGSAQIGGTGAGSTGLTNLVFTASGASSGHPFISL